MAVDYDVIIVGATPAGIEAAIAAATLKARVALITQNITPSHLPETIPQQALRHLAKVLQPQAPGLKPLQSCPSAAVTWQWKQVPEWINAVTNNVAIARSEAALAYHGVDVMAGVGEFCRKPTLGVAVGDRHLSARGYLLTPDARPFIPTIPGLEATGYLTVDQIPAQIANLTAHPTVVILGCGPMAVELAQTLVHLGLQPTLVTQQATLLPGCDRDITQLLQAQLEADGVKIWLQTSIDQVRSQQGQKQLLIGQTVLTGDEIIVAAGHIPNLAPLHLDTVMKWADSKILPKPTLQTAHPRIYTCTGLVGWECFTTVAIAEARVALKNILYFPRHRIHYTTVPFAIQTTPAAAWVGLTRETAIRQYGSRNIYELQRSLHTSPQAQIQDVFTGFCKLIVHRHGKLLGAQLVGPQANEAIGMLALALQQRLSVSAIASLPCPESPLTTLIQATASDFRHQYLKHHPWQQDAIDAFFDLRRGWSRNAHK
jgi:pyruvate/2-oxoglutarate dehydrogenase complex dihydrolipoamide dehydrogenase (E3) component